MNEGITPPNSGTVVEAKLAAPIPTPNQVFAGHATRIAEGWLGKEVGGRSASILANEFASLARLIVHHCGDSGPTTHALNRLRESQMWAVHALPPETEEPHYNDELLDMVFPPQPDEKHGRGSAYEEQGGPA